MRIGKGETIETCLAEYQNMREQLEPLLYTAWYITRSISVILKVWLSPSDEFGRMLKGRLMARLRQESIQAEAVDEAEKYRCPTGWGILGKRGYSPYFLAVSRLHCSIRIFPLSFDVTIHNFHR